MTGSESCKFFSYYQKHPVNHKQDIYHQSNNLKNGKRFGQLAKVKIRLSMCLGDLCANQLRFVPHASSLLSKNANDDECVLVKKRIWEF
jgi:hypothetical protein